MIIEAKEKFNTTFDSINYGVTFVGDCCGEENFYIRICTAQAYDEKGKAFNAICLEDGTPVYFKDDDKVRITLLKAIEISEEEI